MDVVRLDDPRLPPAGNAPARAFPHDPAPGRAIPDEEGPSQLLPWLFPLGFGVPAAVAGTTGGLIRRAPRRLPPGPPPMRIAPTLRALATTPFKLGKAMAPFLAYGRAVESLRADVMPDPHWYLAGIGVDPSAQHRGIGAALLQPGLEAAARARLPAVLLTNNEANLQFYERHGFEVVREQATPKAGPNAWAMVRRP